MKLLWLKYNGKYRLLLYLYSSSTHIYGFDSELVPNEDASRLKSIIESGGRPDKIMSMIKSFCPESCKAFRSLLISKAEIKKEIRQ